MAEGAIRRLVADWAERTPGAEALVDAAGRMTYAQVEAAASAWGDAMAGAGVGRGDRVAVLAPPGREALISLLAANGLAAAWSGLDPRLQPAELAQRLADLRPRLVLTVAGGPGRAFGDELAALCAGLDPRPRLVVVDDAAPGGGADLARFLGGGGEAGAAGAADEGAASSIIVYTSGSSGTPKGAVIRDEAAVAFARMQNALWPVSPLRTLNFLPIGHLGSVVDLTIPTLEAGGCVVFQRKFEALASLRLVAEERVTFWASVPSTFILQAALPEFRQVDLRHVQLIAVEGAPIPADLAAALLPIAPIATNYGMTETCSAITALAPVADVEALVRGVGRPLPDVELRLDEPQDGVGEILVRSPRNLAGYWGRPVETREAFTDDGFFRTGDLGRLLSDGTLKLAGRRREMFKSGGYNVYPAEVERVIEAHPAVDAAAVVPTAHPVWGEVGVAFVMAPAAPPEVAAEVEALCRERLADYKRPKRFVVVDALPLLAIGKVDRVALRARAAEAA